MNAKLNMNIDWNLDQITTLDPARIGEVNAHLILRNVYEPLVDVSEEQPGTVTPCLAERWEFSADGLMVRFRLKRGAKFASGHPLRSEDVVWSMRRAVALNSFVARSLAAWGFLPANVANDFTANGPDEVVVRLSQPFPPDVILPAVFASRATFVIDRQKVQMNSEADELGVTWLNHNTAGSGPFTVTEWHPCKRLTLSRNSPSARSDAKNDGPDVVTIHHVPISKDQKCRLERGRTDVGMLLDTVDIDELLESGLGSLQTVLQFGMEYLAINEGAEPFNSSGVRNALKHVVGLDEMKPYLRFQGIPRAAMVPEGAFGALPPDRCRPLKKDVQRAVDLLARSGHPNGVRTTLAYAAVQPVHRFLAHQIRANALEAGIALELQPLQQAALFEKGRRREFSLMLHGWVCSYPHAHAMLSKHAYNPDPSPEARLYSHPSWRSGFYDPKVNERVNIALFERCSTRKRRYYEDLQEWLIQNGPNIYLYQAARTQFLGARVHRLPHSALRIRLDEAVLR